VRPAFRAVQAIFVGVGWIDYVAIGRPDQVTVQGIAPVGMIGGDKVPGPSERDLAHSAFPESARQRLVFSSRKHYPNLAQMVVLVHGGSNYWQPNQQEQ
jgi:hypothetical protein